MKNTAKVSIVVLAMFLPSLTVFAYNASDDVGQIDTGGAAVFTTNAFAQVRDVGAYLPQDAVIDTTNHRLFVADYNNNRVVEYDLDSSNNLIDRYEDHVLGQPDLSSNAPATTQAGMNAPHGIVFDSANNRLFVADSKNNRVLVYNTTTLVNGENASFVLGHATFTVATEPAFNATVNKMVLAQPGGMDFDPATQRLFVADTNDGRVMIFDVTPATIANGENAIHELGQPDLSTTANITTITQNNFANPAGLAFDPNNNRLFVGDYRNRVMVFDVTPATITDGENATNVLGQANFTTQASPATASQSSISTPNELGYDSANNRLLVPDSGWHRILIFDVSIGVIANNENASHVLGQSSYTTIAAATTQSGLRYPASAWYDSVGKRIFVADSQNNRIQVYNGDPATITNGENALDEIGQIKADGTVSFTTNTTQIYTTNNSSLKYPSDTAIDSSGHRLFVADTLNNRILIYNLDSQNNLVDHYADHVLGATGFKLNLASLSQSGMDNPGSLAYDAVHKRLFVGDLNNYRVLVFNADPAVLTDDENASYVLGQANFTSFDNATVDAKTLSGYPYDLAYDSVNDRLFVADEYNDRVLIFDTAAGTIANGENASHVLGQPDFISSASSTTASTMYFPDGLAFDSSNKRLFVSDYSNSRVLVFNVDPATITDGENASHVLGQPDFISSTSNFAAPNQNGMSGPWGADYDPGKKQLWVADADNNRILVFNADPATITDGENALNVLGQTAFTTSTTGLTQSNYAATNSNYTAPSGNGPNGVMYDSLSNQIYVTDANNNRVLIYKFVNITNSSLAGATQGTAYSQALTLANYQGTASTSLTTGTLPTGITFDGTTLSGTPTQSGTFNLTFQSADTLSTGVFNSLPTSFTLTVASSGGDTTAPTVSVTAPTAAATVSGTISLTASASDNVGVVGVQFKVDGTNSGAEDTASPYSVSLDTTTLTDGAHTITAVARDAAGNSTTSTAVSVTVSNTAGSGSSGSTSSSGGGLPPSYTFPPTPPAGGFGVAVSPTSSDPASGVVDLVLNGGPDAVKMAISNDPALVGAPQIPYANRYPGWHPCGGQAWCEPGKHTVYAEFYTFSGQPSPIVSADYIVQGQATGLTPATIEPTTSAQHSEPSRATSISGSAPAGTTVDSASGSSANSSTGSSPQPTLEPSQEPTESGSSAAANDSQHETTALQDFWSNLAELGRRMPKEIIYYSAGLLVLTLSLIHILNPFKIFRALGSASSLFDIRAALADFVYPLFAALGLRRKKTYWGTVFDSVTKQPIDPVYLSLIDYQTGKEIDTAVSDLMGRFGFLVKPGRYLIEAHRSNYVSPSKNLAGKTTDSVYENLYFGGPIEISESDVVAPNIPMDPTAEDWNQKEKQQVIKFHPHREAFLNFLSTLFFWIGFVLTLVAVIGLHRWHDFLMLGFYFFIELLKLFSHRRLWGRIYDRTGRTLSGATLELYMQGMNSILVSKAVANSQGKFFMRADPGRYELKAYQTGNENKIELGSGEVKTKKEGVLNFDIAV